MFKFIQEALTELEHVVWPTQNETKKYMTYTVGTIVVLASLLAILGYGIRFALTEIRAQFPHEVQQTVSGEDTVTQEELDNLTKNIEKRKKAAVSGEVITVDTGAIETATGK